eukprot:4156345-Amphidinium_carterae.1
MATVRLHADSMRSSAAEFIALIIAAGGTMEFGFDENAIWQTSGSEPNAPNSSLFPEQSRSPFARQQES